MSDVFDIFLLEAVLNGLLLGGLLALLSLGLNLIFGVIDVVWICYAELIMCGMYAVYYLHVQYHWPLVLAMLAAIAIVALLGLILHQFVIRPVLSAEPINQLLVTGGVLFFLQAAATLAFGIEFKNLGISLPSVRIGEMSLSTRYCGRPFGSKTRVACRSTRASPRSPARSPRTATSSGSATGAATAATSASVPCTCPAAASKNV